MPTLDDIEQDEYEDRENEDEGREDSRRCLCGRETIGEQCGFCGQDLCPMCFECTGGGGRID